MAVELWTIVWAPIAFGWVMRIVLKRQMKRVGRVPVTSSPLPGEKLRRDAFYCVKHSEFAPGCCHLPIAYSENVALTRVYEISSRRGARHRGYVG